MLAVEPRSGNRAEEELRAVGVGAGIGHAQHAGAGVLELEILVGELLPVDRFSAGAVVVGEVTALTHELGDHAVERRALVAESLLAGAEGAEVLCRLRHHVGAEFDDHAAGRLVADADVHEATRVLIIGSGHVRSSKSKVCQGKGGTGHRQNGPSGEHVRSNEHGRTFP